MTTLSQLAQLQLEFINRARMDPLGEVALTPGMTSLNQFIQTGSSGFPITADPKQVLAGNNQLTTAAVSHSNQMAATGALAHSGIGDGDPTSRISNAGYTGNNVLRDENIGFASANAMNFNPAALPTQQQLAKQLSDSVHKGLFLDDPAKTFGEDGGHRLSMLDPSYKEVGIGVTFQFTSTANSVDGRLFLTENFGNHSTQSFLTGAVYNDTNGDNFYGLGEAVSGVTATVRNASTGAVIGSDTTGDGGGWSVGEPGGTYKVTFSAAGRADVAAVIEAGTLNAKMDLVNGNQIYANANTTLAEGAAGLRLIGIQNINGTGNAGANVITGNAGSNILTGAGGNDTVDGLGGSDTVVFTGRQSDYKIVINGNTATLQDMRAGSIDGTDTITNVELVKFSDVTVAYTALRNQTPATAVAGSVAIGDAIITEGNAGTKTLIFTVQRTGGTAAFDVNFATADGTAKVSDGDYLAATGVVRFAEGETQKTISVAINGDTKFEASDSFNVNLSNATNGATIADGSGLGTIANDDAQPVAGSVVIGDAIITEGNAGTKTLIFTVQRTGGTAAFDVNFATADGTATVSDGDYLAATGVVRFAEGETQKTISVTINGDTRTEANDSFTVNLSNATNGAAIADGSGLGTIANDDANNNAPTVTGTNVTLTAGGSAAVTSIFTAQDLDGNSTITKYAFWDGGKNGGYFTVNGVAQAPGQWIEVNASDLAKVKYVGSVNGGAESIYAKAFDGNVWSSFTEVKATTLQRAPEDFNKDGNTDILFHNNNGSVAMWQMDGMKILANVGVGTQATTWHAKDAFDFNGDGKADILWHNDSGQVQLWQMDGTKVDQKVDLGSMATTWHVNGVDDFNGDGKAEVLWVSDSRQVYMWNMNGAAHTTANVGTIAAGWNILDTADFNGDGKADILMRNGTKLGMWQMDGATVTKATAFATMGDAFHFAGTGDFSGDGKSDILWHNDANGQVVMWQMDGTNILRNSTVGFAATGWDIADIGDFNHDGRADVLLNSTAGKIGEWQMDGDRVVTAQGIGSVSTDWHLV